MCRVSWIKSLRLTFVKQSFIHFEYKFTVKFLINKYILQIAHLINCRTCSGEIYKSTNINENKKLCTQESQFALTRRYHV